MYSHLISIFNSQNFDLLAMGIIIAAYAIMGYVVFLNNKKSVTNITFLTYSLAAIFYTIVNYLSYHVHSEFLVLLFLRLVIFFATCHTFLLFQLSYVFPKEKVNFPAWYRFIVFPAILFVTLLTLTPFVFSGITELAPIGKVTQAQQAPGIILFGIAILGLVSAGLFNLSKKTITSQGLEKLQFTFVLIGSLITSISLIVFNFVLPVIFNNLLFIPFAPILIFPFIAFTAYAIIKHHLFNVKVIATEVAVFLLLLTLIIQFINAQGLSQEMVSAFVLVSALTIGLFLIQGVLKEVKQREQIGTLNVQLQRSIEELRKVDELKSDFVSLASHQLRTPLTAIKGYVDMLRAGDFGALTGEQKDVSDKVFASSQRMVELIDDLLDVSKLEKEGGFSYKFQVGNPEEVFKAVVEEFQKPAREKGLSLSFASHVGPGINVKFDPEKLKEAISNVVSNSLKYTIEGGVTLSLTESTDMIILTIRDTGVGIDADDIPKIFQKFFRAKAVARLTTEGTGLGLYFTRAVIEDHGGHVWVESDGVGKGSTFIVKLPKVDETAKPPAEGEAKNEKTKIAEADKMIEAVSTVKPPEQKQNTEKALTA